MVKPGPSSAMFERFIFSEPNAEIHIYSNVVIKNKKVYLPRSLRNPRSLPTMYVGWSSKQPSHLKFRHLFRRHKKTRHVEKTLIVFDTWGTSSYYHLLIDHIIPVWITREWLKDKFSVRNEDFEYFRVSNNRYPTELSSADQIFKYFLGKTFSSRIQGQFDRLIHGYLYSYRPFRGPKIEKGFYADYSKYLQKFRLAYVKIITLKYSDLILVPERNNRDFEFVKNFINLYKNEFNFKLVDFSKMTIEDQIEACSTAKIMFGSEGAAFANQLFMPHGSLIMPVSNQVDRFDFHLPLAEYLNFKFSPISLDQTGKPVSPETEIAQTLRDFLAKS